MCYSFFHYVTYQIILAQKVKLEKFDSRYVTGTMFSSTTVQSEEHDNDSKMAVENGTWTYPFAISFSFPFTEANP
jgi:hypothetical protein